MVQRCKDGCCPNSKPYPVPVTILAGVGFLLMVLSLIWLAIGIALFMWGVPGLIGLGVGSLAMVVVMNRVNNR